MRAKTKVHGRQVVGLGPEQPHVSERKQHYKLQRFSSVRLLHHTMLFHRVVENGHSSACPVRLLAHR